MQSLNDIIENCIPILHIYGDIDVDLQLSADVPSIYSHEDRDYLGRAISTLFGELDKHGACNKVRIRTNLEGATQILEFMWNGEPLSEDTIATINARYLEGAKSGIEPLVRGTKIVGYYLNRVSGKVRIENKDDEIYKLRNIVELTIHYK